MKSLALVLLFQLPVSWTNHIIVERDLAVPMRDGTVLRADVYRPQAEGRFPALLMRTPYDKREATQSGRRAMTIAAVRRGYVVVVQDTRGQYRSEGRFLPYLQEIRDGHDTIEWVARLPHVNGKVGTFGLSYPGAVQWMTAPTRPAHLVAMAPAMTFAGANHFTYYGGIFDASFLHWMLGRQIRERERQGLPLTSEESVDEAWRRHGEEWMTYVPLWDLPLMRPFQYWNEWIEHPIESSYWAPFDIEAQHHRVAVPALNFTGWNDDRYGQPGAIRNFTGMRKNGASEEARRGQRLIIGPWTHGVPTLNRTTYYGIDYGPNAGIDFIEPQLRFFDYWLKGIDQGYSSQPPVLIFVMGDNRWRPEREWPLARTVFTRLFLRGGGRLSAEQPDAEEPDSFVYDPARPVRSELLLQSGIRIWDAAGVPDGVISYTSDPLPQDTEITGQILARLWFSSTVPDTDLSARIFEVGPDGSLRSLTVSPGALRVRYRSTEEPVAPRPLTPGRAEELTLSLGYTSRVVPAGSRLRVLITGSLFPDLHANTWEPFARREQARAATHRVHHEAERSSHLVLPLIPR